MSTLLTATAVLALATTCQHSFPPEMFLAIAENESQVAPGQFDPSAMNTNKNGSRDLGLMQINTANLGWLGLTERAAMDPCISIAAAEAVLRQFSQYNSGSPTKSADYARRAYLRMRGGAVTARPMTVSMDAQPAADTPATTKPVPLRDALHAPDSGGLTDLLAGHHPQKPAPDTTQQDTKDSHEDAQ